MRSSGSRAHRPRSWGSSRPSTKDFPFWTTIPALGSASAIRAAAQAAQIRDTLERMPAGYIMVPTLGAALLATVIRRLPEMIGTVPFGTYNSRCE